MRAVGERVERAVRRGGRNGLASVCDKQSEGDVRPHGSDDLAPSLAEADASAKTERNVGADSGGDFEKVFVRERIPAELVQHPDRRGGVGASSGETRGGRYSFFEREDDVAGLFSAGAEKGIGGFEDEVFPSAIAKNLYLYVVPGDNVYPHSSLIIKYTYPHEL